MISCSWLLRALAMAFGLVAVSTEACTPASRPDASARDVSAAFLDAVAKARWREAGAVLDLEQLESLRKERVAAERQRRRSPFITIGQLMQSNPDMPRSVAEYQLKQMVEQRSRSLLKFDFGVTDPDSLLALPIETVAAQWVEVHDERWQNREMNRVCSDDGRGNDLPLPAFHVIGSVIDGGRAYVVYSDTVWQKGVDPLYAPPPRVIQLRSMGKRWQIIPRGDLMGLPDMVHACG